ADGLAFPTEELLAALRSRLRGDVPLLAAGLSTPGGPASRAATRVFCRQEIFPSSCLALAFYGAALQAEVAREVDNALLRNLLAQTTRAYERQRLGVAARAEAGPGTLPPLRDGGPAPD